MLQFSVDLLTQCTIESDSNVTTTYLALCTHVTR